MAITDSSIQYSIFKYLHSEESLDQTVDNWFMEYEIRFIYVTILGLSDKGRLTIDNLSIL